MMARSLILLLATMAVMLDGAAFAEPVDDVIDACSRTLQAPEPTILVERGWSEDTESDNHDVLAEMRNIEIRAKLSSLSYPDEWSDATVARGWPSTQTSTLGGLARPYRRTHVPARLFDDPAGSGRVVVMGGNCYFVGMIADNPKLADFASALPGAVVGASVYRPVLRDGEEFTISLLSDHGLRDDPLFPVDHDLAVLLSPPRPLR